MDNVPVITVDPELAKTQLQEYRNIEVKHRREVDAAFRKMWRAAASGKPILDLSAAFRSTGLSEQFLPRLGFARAYWKECHFDGYWNRFSFARNVRRGRDNVLAIPRGSWDLNLVSRKSAFTKVPFIPPAVRKAMKLNIENYFILFEVTDWKQYPADPYLLQHITNNLYVVVGEWDLTPLEVALLKGL